MEISNGYLKLDSNKYSASFINCTFEEIASATGSCGISLSISSLTVSDCVFRKLSTGDNGCAIHGGSTPSISIEGCTIESCHCDGYYGGYGGGGGIHIQGDTLSASIIGCTFINNDSPINGQSINIYHYGGALISTEIGNCTFKGHTSGVIISIVKNNYASVSESFELSNCSFVDNAIATNHTYGIINATMFTGGVTYDHCIFKNDQCPASGLISASNRGSTGVSLCRLVDCEFSSCASSGGSIVFCSAEYTVNDVSILNSSFINSGHVLKLDCSGCRVSIRESDFTECESSTSSILDCGQCASYTVDQCQFDRVRSSGNGGVILFDSSACSTSVVGCLFQSCECRNSGNGGAIYVKRRSDNAGSIVIEHCVFSGCIGSKGRSVHFVFDGSDWTSESVSKFGLRNCTFSNHEQSDGSSSSYPIYFEYPSGDPTYIVQTDLTVADLNFFDNSFKQSDGLVAIWSSTSLTYENCYFRGNEQVGTLEGGLIMASYSSVSESSAGPSCTFSHCLFESCTVRSKSIIFMKNDNKCNTLRLSECHFHSCTSTGSPCVLGISSGVCTNVDVELCDIVDCSGVGQSDKGLLLDIICDSLKLLNNVIEVTDVSFSQLSVDFRELQALEVVDCVFRRLNSDKSNSRARGLNTLGGLVRLGTHVEECTVFNCSFDYSVSDQPQIQSLILQSIPLLRLDFVACTATNVFANGPGLTSFVGSSARVLDDQLYSTNMNVSRCFFTDCRSISGSFLDLYCSNLLLEENSIEQSQSGGVSQVPCCRYKLECKNHGG